MQTFDCIVIGLGGVGTSALLAASERNLNVLGIDQYSAVHSRGSSHGHTRIVRTSYFEHPNYVPLAQDSITRWRKIEDECGRELMKLDGLLQVGPQNGSVVEGVLASANKYQLPVEVFQAAEAERRFPEFRIRENELAIYEESAGYLFVERCIEAQLKLAKSKGAKVEFDVSLQAWERTADGLIKITTSSNEFVTKGLIVATGAWSDDFLLPQLPLNLSVKRKSQFWFDVDPDQQDKLANIPTFFFETDSGCYYGFPWLENVGIKISEHTGGEPVTDPSNVDRTLYKHEQERLESFVRERFSDLCPRLREHSVCMYTMTPDEHCVVDRLPSVENVVFAAGLSGHGFKFTPLLGVHLVELLLGKENHLLDFLKIRPEVLANSRSTNSTDPQGT